MAHSVDLIFVIDVTGSMGPFINNVKEHVLNFHDDLVEKGRKIQKNIEHLRVKVIAYRDYYAGDSCSPMEITDFFNLPEEESKLEEFVRKIQPDGGGDEPENGLEALALAIKSDWVKETTRCRHIISLWTDASAHPFWNPSLGKAKPSNYPENMPESLSDLTSMWGQLMNGSFKRLILFTPDVTPWKMIGEDWDNVVHHTGQAGAGLKDTDYNSIIEVILNSI